MSVLFGNLVETLDRLQRSAPTMKNSVYTANAAGDTFVESTAGVQVPGQKDGLYALIDILIADLGAIKRSVKAEEAKIRFDVDAEIVRSAAGDGDGTGDTTPANDTGGAREITPDETNGCVQANRASSDSGAASHGGEAGGRYTKVSNPSTMPAVLRVADVYYSENAVFSVIAEAAALVKKLRNGKHSTGVLLGVKDGMALI